MNLISHCVCSLTIGSPCCAAPKSPTARVTDSVSCVLTTKTLPILMSLCIMLTESPSTMNRRSWSIGHSKLIETRRRDEIVSGAHHAVCERVIMNVRCMSDWPRGSQFEVWGAVLCQTKSKGEPFKALYTIICRRVSARCSLDPVDNHIRSSYLTLHVSAVATFSCCLKICVISLVSKSS